LPASTRTSAICFVYETGTTPSDLETCRLASRRGLPGPRGVVGGLLAVLLLIGCGRHSDRLAITGNVSLNGVPLDTGSIRISAAEGEQRMATGALIADGQFSIPADKGLRPGTYRVQITSPDLKASPVMAPATPSGPGFPVQPDRIPPEYNVDCKKTIDVTSNGDNDFTFAIVNPSAK
jgi:hypothetical protein